MDLVKQYAGQSVLDVGCATGGYCLELNKQGFKCTGLDVNNDYVKIAKKNGVNAYLIKEEFPFKDKTFDTVVLFELIEHVVEPDKILKEARRVAKKNILISVPNCNGFEALKNYGLTYEHFLEMDHINFFTKDSLTTLLSKHFDDFKIMEVDPIYPLLLNYKGVLGKIIWVPLRKFITMCYKLGILKSDYYRGLQVVVTL